MSSPTICALDAKAARANRSVVSSEDAIVEHCRVRRDQLAQRAARVLDDAGARDLSDAEQRNVDQLLAESETWQRRYTDHRERGEASRTRASVRREPLVYERGARSFFFDV